MRVFYLLLILLLLAIIITCTIIVYNPLFKSIGILMIMYFIVLAVIEVKELSMRKLRNPIWLNYKILNKKEFDSLEVKSLLPEYFIKYSNDMFLKFFFGIKKIKDINKDDLNRLIQNLENTLCEEIKTGTVNLYLYLEEISLLDEEIVIFKFKYEDVDILFKENNNDTKESRINSSLT